MRGCETTSCLSVLRADRHREGQTCVSMAMSGCSPFPMCWDREYDRHLAAAVSAGKTMATAYLDPNLNHALLGGAKSRLSAGGSDRTMAGSVDRVLKVFHHFETNTEHSCWSSNIRYGDATDVRGIIQKILDIHKVRWTSCFGLRLSNGQSRDQVHWLHPDMGVSHVREKYDQARPNEEWR
ncbi:protein tyrosine kinase 2aa isoform X13 [Perca fluviatilis]|nr:protein tyrosine kinase 2aa isoform X13 [Perca fluviatilis]